MAYRKAVKSEKLHGISTPTLLEQLQAILRHYSDGQILKELLQNAEDAGATEIRFLYDENRYGTESLLQDNLADFQGPALCSYNNAVFKDDDWEGIQRLARSGKKNDVLKVGRFGIGFSSVYHLTDLPCIISKEVLAMIDPFEKYFYRNGRSTSSCGWCLDSVIEDYRDQLQPFQAALPPGVQFQDERFFPGTLFRFPLRKVPNSLSQSVFSPEKTRDLLKAFQEDARIVLLFLRKIERVHIDLRKCHSSKTTLVLEVSCDPSSIDELRQKRQNFNRFIQKFGETSDGSRNIDMTTTFDLNTKWIDLNTVYSYQVKETWVVSQEIGLKCSPQLAFLYQELQFLPWVGVAVPLFNQAVMKGRTFCFLPLPPGEDSLSGLPVHVHGFFAVSDDRRSLKWPSCDRIQNKEAEWNKLLVNEVLPQVYLKAVLEAIRVTLERNLDPDIVYKAIPDLNRKLGHWKEAVDTLFSSLFQHTVLYCRAKNTWMSINEVIIMTQDLPVASKRSKVIVKCLQRSGFHVIEDLPEHMRTAIRKFASEASSVSPSLVISCLSSQAINKYSDEDRLYLLDYLLEQRSSSRDLDGLQLLPTDAGTFVKIKENPRASDIIYIGTSSCPQHLLPAMHHRFLRNRLGRTFSNLRRTLEGMCSSGNWKQLHLLNVATVIKLLPEALPTSWSQGSEDQVFWFPTQEGQPDFEWLKSVWQFACHQEIDLADFKGLKILPVSNMNASPVQMITLVQKSRVINVDKADTSIPNFSEITTVLQRVEVIICKIPNFVSKHYQILNSTFVHTFHADGVLQALKAVGAFKIESKCSADVQTRDLFCSHVLPYLSDARFSHSDDQFLRNLPVFKTFQNKKTEAKELVSLSSGVLVLQQKDLIRLPQIPLQRKYLLVHSSALLYLLHKLRVFPQSFEDILKGILQDCLNGRYNGREINVLSQWIRLNYDQINSIPGVLNLLTEVSFVPNGNNELKRPRDLYDVSDYFVKALIHDKSVLLSMDKSWLSWLQNLRILGLKAQRSITPNDVLNAASNISRRKNVLQAAVLVEYLCMYPQCLQNNCRTLKQTAFIACMSKAPPFYPKSLSFYGKQGLLCKPADLVAYSKKTCYLLGASTPMVDIISNDSVLDRLCVRREPTVREVLLQLKQCVLLKGQLGPHWGMLRCIYNFLNEKIVTHREIILNGLPPKWIFVDDQFVDAKSVYKEEGPGGIDLRPFLCILPREYSEYNELLRATGVPDHVTNDVSFLVDVLETIKTNIECIDTDARLRVSINILRRFLEYGDEIDDEDIRCRLYVPTRCFPMKMLPPDQVCYDDTSYDKDGDDFDMNGDEPPIYLVHNEVPPYMAKKLGVISLSKRLACADEIGGIVQTGQYEPITVRLKNILRDGYQPESIPKEMVQNAEDAGASEVRFLLDLRSNVNAMKRLLDPAMSEVQGPALWVYNDAVFTKEDLENITKLGGATKGEDQSKIGQFGLGFNAVYHITDVPSFVTNDCITIFDPHKTHLKCHFGGEGTGIQINFMSNTRLTRFQDQFLPYEGVFGCKMLRDKNGPERYNHTLFRLPLRNENEAKNSDICGESYDEEKMKSLLKSLCFTASQMLLFTEKVKTISVHLLEKDEVSSMVLLYKVTKSTTTSHKNPSNVSFRDAVHSSVKMRDWGCMPRETTSIVMCKRQWTEEGAHYFGFCNNQPQSHEKWVVVMSGGKGRSFNLCLGDGAKSGLLPCGGVAWNPNANTDGGVFCFLPLAVPQSGLPVCINGSFAVSADRRSIWRKSDSDSTSRTAAFKTTWNQYLFEDIIVSAYVTLLQQDTIQEYASRHGEPYFLWPNPLKTSKNSDYGKVMTGFYKSIFCGVEGETPPKVFWKEGEIYSIGDVFFAIDIIQNDHKMFPIVERVCKQMTLREMIKIPTWVKTGFKEAGYLSEIMRMTYSWERFFREIFLPNFRQLQDEDIISLLLKALSMHDDAVLNCMKLAECIPTKTSHGTIYKKPSSLLDPIRFKDIFSKDEEVFPDDQFLRALDKHQKETLKDLGCLKDDLSWEGVLERAQTVQSIWKINKDEAILRVKALLNFIDHKLQVHRSGHQNVENALREVAFLPAARGGYVDLQSPSNVYLAEERDLVGYVCHILDTSNTGGTLSPSVCRLLGLQGKKVKVVNVIENLCRLKEMHANDVGPNPLQKQCEPIYRYLQKHLEEEDVLHFLRHETFFCLDQDFIETNRLACSSDSFPPYLFQIPAYLTHNFHPLLKAAGVKDRFDFNDFIRTLNLIKEDQNGEPLDQEMVSNILTKVMKPLFDMADKIPAEQIPRILLPDSKNMLQPSGSLSYCDLDSFKHLTSKYKLCHGEMSSLHAKKLGVRDIRDQMLKKYSQTLPGYGGIGESFGQREELITRITRIMEGYPCDFSILKELVQNADDAKATQVHFVLDERKHPTNRLFYNSMSQLQGPALLAYNDRPFTDDDIKGIQRLGEGSKSDESDKTGRYGVGFNVVYHLTDCPMFVSGGNTLCIFDPTLQYVLDADVLCPGRMFRPIDREMLDSYRDLFNCFFSFQNDFKLQEGTLFRFPLRQKKSEISGEISPSDIKDLFTRFKEEMFDILLFLKNVTEISFSTCTNGKLDTTYTVTANLSQEQAVERKRFFQRMTEQNECTLLDFPVSDLQYQTSIADNDGRVELWLVHQRVGIANKDRIPESVNHANTVTKLRLLPKGGVAAKLMCLKSGRKVESKTDGKAFCFLPLPIGTNLPVHVDGYFALGHEARRNLWEAPPGDPKSDWNRLIAKEIVAPIYVLMVEKIKANITDFAGKGMERRKLKDRLQHYHSLFPLNFKANKVTSLNVWDELGQEFYQRVTQEKLVLFPVVYPENWQDTPGPLPCPRRSNQTDGHLVWKSCVLNAENEGYFDDIHLQIPQNETEREAARSVKEKQTPKFWQLRHLLLNLGFPLLETPLKFYNIMERILSNMEREAPRVLKVSPQSVESFLKTVAKMTTLQGLPLNLKETRMSSKLELQLLVEYVTKTPELKLCGLPLLLTNDDVLREFSTRSKVFYSWYHSLLPMCAGEFLHSQFLSMFKKEDDCFAELELSDLVERLPDHLPRDQFCTGEYIQWPQNTRTKVRTPRTDWVKKLWQYLFENREKPEWKANVVQTFGNWSILPVHGENQAVKHLVPITLSKTVLSPRYSLYHMEMEKVLKCLHCPIVDTRTLKEVEPFNVHQQAVEECCQFVMAFASNLDNAGHTLLVFERLVKYKLDRFETLKKEGHRCILNYFSKQAGLLSGNERNLTILKSLPCFETIHGDFVALTGKKIYAVVIDRVPKCDQNIWLLQSGCVFLKHDSHLAEFFKILRVEDLSDVELYKQFILPCFRQFSIAAQWEHLSRIIDMIRTNLKPDGIIRTLNLNIIPIVPQENGNPRLASSFCDDDNPVFKEMLEDRYFPPKHPDQEYQNLWPQFLRQIGIQTDVSYAQFEDFANKLSKEPRNCRREKILIDYFFDSHHLHSDRDFLTRLASIPFISAADTSNELRELHEPCSTEKVALSAVPEEHQKLVWTKEAVLPRWIYSKKCQTCKTGGYLETVLMKTKEPSLNQVFLHTQTLCCSLAKLQESSLPLNYQHPLIKHERALNQVIIDILKFLSEKCEKAQKCETCAEKRKCCSICKQIVTALEDIPVVPLKGGEFFKAKRLTKHLPKKENDKLFLFLKKLPNHFIPYCNLLFCMGTTEEPSLIQYASTLKLIKQQSLSDQRKNPNILRAAEQAVECFFRVLSKEENVQLGEIEELFLLTNKKHSPLLRSTELYYNDEPSFASRLKCFPHPMMRTVDESALKSYLNMEKLIGNLEHLKPLLISETVDEILTINDECKPKTVCECSLSQQLKKVFSWRTFYRALKIILENEDVTNGTEHDELLATNFTVKCLNEIPTELRMKDGTVIRQSQTDAGVKFSKTETQEVDVIISHSANDTLIQIQIADGFNKCFGNFLKSTKFLGIVLTSKSEKEVITNLITMGLKTTSDELQDLINNPVLGSEIEEDVICLLIPDPFCHFSLNEYVGYNDTQGEDEHRVYAKIIQKVDNDTDVTSEDEHFMVKYIIEVGGKEQIEVEAIWLYKFLPPKDEPSMPEDEKTHLYNPNGPQSSLTDVVVFKGQSSQQESSDSSDDFKDLDKTKREITKFIEKVWKKEDSIRNTALRRLMRKWHPDKHKEEHKKFAEEVFKHIRREIERMEKGIPSGVDTDDDIFRWAQRNTAEQRHYWQFHQRRYGRRGRRGWGSRGGGWNTSSSNGFNTPPSFHKINLEACRWLKQARIDLEAAAAVVNDHKVYFQWKSSLCFFAVEKSVNAAQLVCGCGISDKHSLMDAALKLKRHLDVTEAIQQLVQIVQKNSHYPSSCSVKSIPHENFTREHADESIKIAQRIISKVDNYIKYG